MIKDLSERRRMPRLGKVRLGVLVHPASGKPYPRATDYFVVEDRVQKVHGEKPKELPIMFPVDDPGAIFPQDLKAYTTSGLFCKGNGERATRWVNGDLVERECPCELLDEGKCKPLATLNFFLPHVPGVGVWQMNTSNKETITLLNSALESFGRMFSGLAGIPFVLRIGPHQTQRWDEDKKQMVKATVQVVSLDSPHTLLEIMEWRQKALGVKSQMMFLPDADVPKDVMERAQETGETLVRPSDPAAGEEARREQVLTDLWTVFLDAAGGKAEKASALSIKAVKRHLGRDVGGLADLTLEEVRTLAGLIRPEGPGQ